MLRIDLNADLGEGAGHDDALLDFVTSANIACGGHAGDPDTMARTIELARRKGVAIGAHPGFPDRENFGRQAMEVSATEVHDFVLDQVRALLDLSRAADMPLNHIKPHGALYNAAATDAPLADAIATAVASIDPTLVLFGLAGSELIAAGERVGLRTAAEGFADRTYAPDGTLTPRSEAGALIEDPVLAAAQAIRLVTKAKVRSQQGPDVEVRVDTICIHGDTPGALANARHIREAFNQAGIDVSSPVR